MACGQFTNVTRQSGSWMRPVDSRLVGHTDYHACQDRLVAHWQQKGIIPRPCRLAVTTQRVHEPTHPCSSTSSTGPWPALDVLTTPQPVVVHHPAVCQMSQLTTALRYSSDRALSERLPPPPSQHSATSYSVLCPIAAAAANGRRGRNSASFRVLQRNATVARPCPVDRRARAAPLHMLAGKPETAFWRESTERQQRLACSAWDGCRTAGEGSGARTG
jgi:hypothetical protein